MKHLYIRFFTDKVNQIPTDSNKLFVGSGTVVETAHAIQDQALDAVTWMLRYPEGKVDFVWF